MVRSVCGFFVIASLIVSAASSAPAATLRQVPLAADVDGVAELIDVATRDLEALARQAPQLALTTKPMDHVRTRLKAGLGGHLINIKGEPHFDHDLTHYVRESRRGRSSFARSSHITKCPICNAIAAGVATGSGVRPPRLALPFENVFLNGSWFRVDPGGFLFLVVDPTTATTSFVPKGRLLMHDGRWWAATGWLWNGPLEKFQ